jgi:hypothetical protein
MKKRNILVYIFLLIILSFIFVIFYSPKYYFLKQIEDDYYIVKETKSSSVQIIKLIEHDWDYWMVLVNNVGEVYRGGNSLEVSANGEYYSLTIGVTDYPEDVKRIFDISRQIKDNKIFDSNAILHSK